MWHKNKCTLYTAGKPALAKYWPVACLLAERILNAMVLVSWWYLSHFHRRSDFFLWLDTICQTVDCHVHAIFFCSFFYDSINAKWTFDVCSQFRVHGNVTEIYTLLFRCSFCFLLYWPCVRCELNTGMYIHFTVNTGVDSYVTVSIPHLTPCMECQIGDGEHLNAQPCGGLMVHEQICSSINCKTSMEMSRCVSRFGAVSNVKCVWRCSSEWAGFV